MLEKSVGEHCRREVWEKSWGEMLRRSVVEKRCSRCCKEVSEKSVGTLQRRQKKPTNAQVRAVYFNITCEHSGLRFPFFCDVLYVIYIYILHNYVVQCRICSIKILQGLFFKKQNAYTFLFFIRALW